jgi:hypothetical protein
MAFTGMSRTLASLNPKQQEEKGYFIGKITFKPEKEDAEKKYSLGIVTRSTSVVELDTGAWQQ